MKHFGSKKAISPVITTVLLVLMVLVLASIIVIWWKSFIGESITKFDESGKPKSIETFCSKVVIDASLSGASVTVLNKGTIPIYKIGVQRESTTSKKIDLFNYQLIAGASRTFSLGYSPDSEDKLYMIPILLGSNDQGEQKEFQCGEGTWKKIV